MRVSVVVPVLDEAAQIEAVLEDLVSGHEFFELVVVDGHSTDNTVDLAKRFDGVRVLTAPRGRASQMNAGARVATGDVLLFLHADVRLPHDAQAHVDRALSDERVVAGAFRIRTVCDDQHPPHRWLIPLLPLADIRSRLTRIPYGDQAIFIRKAIFEQIGGYPDQPLMEDIELSRRLHQIGPIARVPATVQVSARRFLARPVYYTMLVNVFPLLYRLGVPPAHLARLYRPERR